MSRLLTMNQHERALVHTMLRSARLSAYEPGEYVGQESFMRASEILGLAVRAGVAPGVSVLDLCCGVGGPGTLVTRELGCTYTGVDASPAAIEVARENAVGVDCRFEVAHVPPVPRGPFDVVLLLETLLGFRDKAPLVRGVARALAPGGRFALTVEEGRPLTEGERSRMPDADTVWPVPLPELVSLLAGEGLRVRWQEECTRAHLGVVDALVDAFAGEAPQRALLPHVAAVDDLLAGHRLWSEWLGGGRLRKFALVAEKSPMA